MATFNVKDFHLVDETDQTKTLEFDLSPLTTGTMRKVSVPDKDGTIAMLDDIGSPDVSGAWPVGSVFMAVVSTNPATLLGFGTWSQIAAGRVLVGQDSGDTDFDTPEETGGAKTVASSAQTFAGDALAGHSHGPGTLAVSAHVADVGTNQWDEQAADSFLQDHTLSGSTESVSAGTPSGTNTPGAATSVVQPYFVVYIWKRTA